MTNHDFNGKPYNANAADKNRSIWISDLTWQKKFSGKVLRRSQQNEDLLNSSLPGVQHRFTLRCSLQDSAPSYPAVLEYQDYDRSCSGNKKSREAN